jgi:hypothetical protein
MAVAVPGKEEGCPAAARGSGNVNKPLPLRRSSLLTLDRAAGRRSEGVLLPDRQIEIETS